MMTENASVSLRANMGHALWTGIWLQPDTDIEFRLEPFLQSCRLIRLRLVKPDGSGVSLATGSSFEMSTLGRDCEHLETLGADLVTITRCVSRIAASMEPDGGVLLRVTILDDEQLFRLYAKEPGRCQVDRWEWFQDPCIVYANGVPIHVPRLVNDGPQWPAVA